MEYDRPSLNPFCFSEKIFCFLFVSFLERMKCVLGQLEVTEMLECKPYCVAPSFQRNTAAQKFNTAAQKFNYHAKKGRIYRLVRIPPSGREPPVVGLTRIRKAPRTQPS